MRARRYPILDFDPSVPAIIEPSQIIHKTDLLNRVVLCFFYDVIDQLVSAGKVMKVGAMHSEMGENPIYQLDFQGQPMLLAHPGVGAPLAAGYLEELIARGCDRVVACGGAGVLDPKFVVGHVLIPVEALRDEGTSYAYMPPEEKTVMDPAVIQVLESVLMDKNVPFNLVKTWTTDTFYRETPAKAALRKRQGCQVVEMETSAFLAVAKFRNVRFGQYLYGGDSVQESGWDNRDWDEHVSVRENLLWLACEAVTRL
jgi:uridine phosphorylase